MKQRKSAETRRQEFLDVSLRLFAEKGFDRTTVQDIIDAVGVSKGTFYHYFDSKREVVEELAQGLSQYAAQLIEDIAAQDIDAVKKLNSALTIQEVKQEHLRKKAQMQGALGRSGNFYLAQRLIDIMLETCAAPFAVIVAQGSKQGIFDVPDIKEATDCLLRMMLTLKQSLSRLEDPSLMRSRVQFYEHAVARVLGAPPCSVNLLEPLMRRYLSEREQGTQTKAN